MIRDLTGRIGYSKIVCSVLFWIAAFLFFATVYQYHLHYQEQFQMFLFSSSYFLSALYKIGGIADYLGSFFTQLYFYSWMGAIVIASLLTLIQCMFARIFLNFKVAGLFYPFSFIPSILYWYLLLDENYLLGGTIALAIVIFAICIYSSFEASRASDLSILLVSPVLFWMAGGIALLLPIYSLVSCLIKPQHKLQRIVCGAGAILLILLTLFIAKNTLLQYPYIRSFIGVNYYRFPVVVPVTILVIALFVVAMPLLFSLLSRKFRPHGLFLPLICLALAGGAFGLIYSGADKAKEEIMAYDFLVRMACWDSVIEMADKKPPETPLAVTYLNLALAKKNLMGEKMFTYYQNGVSGLIPNFVRDFYIPLIS